MIPPALDWFIKLGTKYTKFSNPPKDALDLCNALAVAVQSKNDKLEVNRAFKKFSLKLPAILNWLNSQYLYNAIINMKSQAAIEVYSEVVVALSAIKDGDIPSTRWRMEKQRGVNIGFSTTLEAAALVGYLTKIKADDWLPENLYQDSEDSNDEYQEKKPFYEAKALEIASTLFKINKDNIRKYKNLTPVDDQSEAAMGLFGLTRINALNNADKFFDVDDMVEASKSKDVTI